MRGVVLGARGAVGAETIAELRRRGHETIAVSRTAASDVQADVATARGRAVLLGALREGDVVINASGREDLEIAELAHAAPLVEVSANGSYLDELSTRLRADPSTASAVLGAGIAPGLSTVLLAALQAETGDDLDLGVTLGSGERHGDAAMEWTQSLLGAPLYRAPEGRIVRNLRESRVLPGLGGRGRRHLRADFPDHVLLGASRGTPVRSYLALSSGVMTDALGLLARMPFLAGALRLVPPMGSEAWRIVAVHRRTGESLAVAGEGQSRATGVLAALAAERVAEVVRFTGTPAVLTMADLCTPDEAAERLGTAVVVSRRRRLSSHS